MQASRASSRVLQTIIAGNRQTRNLHVTGSATFSNLLNSERRALNFPRDIAGLQAECQKRKLPTVGSENELLNRLTAHEMASSRAFSSQASKRPTPSSTSAGTPARHFNTSRTLKAVNDSSTIDFAFIPDFDPDTGISSVVRVPILPQTNISDAAKAHTAADGEEEAGLPTVESVSILGGAADDLQDLAASFSKRLSGASDSREPGMASEIWNSFLDDILGSGRNQGRSGI